MSVNQVELDVVMKNYLEAQEKLSEAKSELDKFVSHSGAENVLKVLFKPLFDKNPDLNILGYVGTTPSFNDGEPCTHYGQFFTGLDNDFLHETGGFEEDFEYDEDEGTHLNSECINLDSVSEEGSAFENIIEDFYGTNYKIVVKRKENGEITVLQDYYDPGY